MGRFLWRLRQKIQKRWARKPFFPGWRVRLLRWCGYRIGQDVYVADDLLIAEELEDRDNLTLGDRVSIAPRVTLVLSSHPHDSRIRPRPGRGPRSWSSPTCGSAPAWWCCPACGSVGARSSAPTASSPPTSRH